MPDLVGAYMWAGDALGSASVTHGTLSLKSLSIAMRPRRISLESG
jgi:hypothetical protein